MTPTSELFKFRQFPPEGAYQILMKRYDLHNSSQGSENDILPLLVPPLAGNRGPNLENIVRSFPAPLHLPGLLVPGINHRTNMGFWAWFKIRQFWVTKQAKMDHPSMAKTCYRLLDFRAMPGCA